MYNKILTVASVLTTIVTFFVYANVAKAQFVTEGLVSYWSFEADTIEGKTVRDVWGKNDGTLVGDAKRKVGKVGSALEFDGDGDSVDCGNDESLNFDTEDPFTICAWVKADEKGLTVLQPWQEWGQSVAGKVNDRWHGYILTITGAGHNNEPYTLNAVLSNTLGNNDINCSSPDNSMTIATDWTYVCMSYEGTSNVAGIHLFINGENQPVSTQRDGLTASMSSRARFTIGQVKVTNWPIWFDGLIDEVAVYNRALSEDEISQNFAENGLAVQPTDKLAHTWGAIKVSK